MRIVLAGLLVVATLPPSVARAEDTPIQPGARMTSPAGCTLNFVFRDDADRRYIGTAGHCVRGVGDRVADAAGSEFGTVVFRAFRGVGAGDFALIRIDEARLSDVNPAMRRWGGPTGYTTYTETLRGDRLLLHGYGMVFGSNATTRSRAGILITDDDEWYRSDVPAIFGDSGGPILHANGKALGVVSGIGGGGLPPPTLLGPTVEGVLALMADEGIHVSLVTAPYAPEIP